MFKREVTPGTRVMSGRVWDSMSLRISAHADWPEGERRGMRVRTSESRSIVPALGSAEATAIMRDFRALKSRRPGGVRVPSMSKMTPLMGWSVGGISGRDLADLAGRALVDSRHTGRARRSEAGAAAGRKRARERESMERRWWRRRREKILRIGAKVGVGREAKNGLAVGREAKTES